MKIKILIISFVFLTLFSSCSKKTVEVNQNNAQIAKQINDFIFELARYSLTGECDLKNPEKYFFPKELNTFTGRYYFENGNQYLLVEKYFPQKRGLIESSGFYNPSNDNALWVDSLLIELEEERIALSIGEMEDEYSLGKYEDNFDYEATINAALDENAVTEEIVGKDSKLRIMQFDKEILIPNENVFIEVNGSNVNRKFYNEDYKLIKVECWEISGSNNSKLKQTEEYFFEKGAQKPYKKVIKNEKQYSNFFYNERGDSVKSEKHILLENDKDILVSVSEWSYNDSNKVTSEKNLCYYYDKDYKKLDYVFEKKYIYKYNDFTDVLSEDENEKIPADFTYYEDNVLKMKNKYTAELGTYTSQVFFENKLAVKTYFNKYKRQKEVYTVGDEVIRVKEYE